MSQYCLRPQAEGNHKIGILSANFNLIRADLKNCFQIGTIVSKCFLYIEAMISARNLDFFQTCIFMPGPYYKGGHKAVQ